jgi:hypothetical protein
MRKLFMVTVALAVALGISIPLVLAGGVQPSGSLDHQTATSRESSISTTNTSFAVLPGLSTEICALGEVAATLSVKLSGAPVAFQVRVDGAGTMAPGAARFVPQGAEDSGSFTFVQNAATFEANDNHGYQVEWRSVTGNTARVLKADLNLQFQDGNACPSR